MSQDLWHLRKRVDALEKAVKALEKKPAEITSDPREHPGRATCTCGHRKYQHNEETGCMAQADGANCSCCCFVQRVEEPPEKEPAPTITCPRCLCAGARTRKHNPDWALCPHCSWDFLKPSRRRNVSPLCACGHESEFHFEKGPCTGLADSEPCACRLYRPPSDPVEPAPDGPGYTPAELFAELDRVVKGPQEIVAESWVALNRVVKLGWATSIGIFKPAVVEPTTLGRSIHRDVFGTEGK